MSGFLEDLQPTAICTCPSYHPIQLQAIVRYAYQKFEHEYKLIKIIIIIIIKCKFFYISQNKQNNKILAVFLFHINKQILIQLSVNDSIMKTHIYHEKKI